MSHSGIPRGPLNVSTRENFFPRRSVAPFREGDGPVHSKKYKVTLLGDSSVGKTSLGLSAYNGPQEPPGKNETSPTLRADIIGLRVFPSNSTTNGGGGGGENYYVELWDTAGQERFKSMTTINCRGTDAIILVFDISSRETFDNCGSWLDIILDSLNSSRVLIPKVFLVGNKKDLRPQTTTKKVGNDASKREKASSEERGGCDEKKFVGIDEAMRFAQANNLAYLETSAITGEQVCVLFEKIVEELRKCDSESVREIFEEGVRGKGASAVGGGSIKPNEKKPKKMEKRYDFEFYDEHSSGDISERRNNRKETGPISLSREGNSGNIPEEDQTCSCW